MQIRRLPPPVAVGAAAFLLAFQAFAQSVEPGVGLWGVLEVGRLRSQQEQGFLREYSNDPEDYGIVVVDRNNVIVEIRFEGPGFNAEIRGVPVRIGQVVTAKEIDRIGELDRSGLVVDSPDLGIKLLLGEENQELRLDEIVVYPPEG